MSAGFKCEVQRSIQWLLGIDSLPSLLPPWLSLSVMVDVVFVYDGIVSIDMLKTVGYDFLEKLFPFPRKLPVATPVPAAYVQTSSFQSVRPPIGKRSSSREPRNLKAAFRVHSTKQSYHGLSAEKHFPFFTGNLSGSLRFISGYLLW